MTFEPGSHRLHTHPLGQTLIVTSGSGLVQREAGLSRRSRPAMSSGLHRGKALAWRVAANCMTHIAIQEVKDGKVVDWMEHVTDTQYAGG